NELVNLSRELLEAKTLDEILGFAVDNAANSLRTEFIAIVLVDENGSLRIAGWRGWTEKDITEYERDQGRYQTKYTIDQGEPVIVTDYSDEKRFMIPEMVKSRGIKSGISVPMFSSDKAVGAILAHYVDRQPFLDSQARPLSLIANLTAIAVQHLRAVESKIASLSAVKRASDEISKIR